MVQLMGLQRNAVKADRTDSVFSRGRRYGRRFVSSWGGRSRGGYRSRRGPSLLSLARSSSRSPSYAGASQFSYSGPTSGDGTTITPAVATAANYSRSGGSYSSEASGCGTFLLIIAIIIGLPIIVLTPLVIIAAPIFFIVAVIFIFAECMKGG